MKRSIETKATVVDIGQQPVTDTVIEDYIAARKDDAI